MTALQWSALVVLVLGSCRAAPEERAAETVRSHARDSMANQADTERALLAAIADPATSRADLSRSLKAVPSTQRFVDVEGWSRLSSDTSLDDARRLAVLQVRIDHLVDFPVALDAFVKAELEPLGIREAALTDMTMASHVPVRRGDGIQVWMAQLPFRTALGGSAVYLAVTRGTRLVREAAVYPGIHED